MSLAKIRRGCYFYRGLIIERYLDGDLKGYWDIVIRQSPDRCVTGPFKRLRDAKNWIDFEKTGVNALSRHEQGHGKNLPTV